MRPFRLNSISAKLALFALAFVAIVIGLGGFAASRLVEIDRVTADLGDRWVRTTLLLGEASDRVVEFRLAETDRALSPDEAAVAESETLAEEHRDVVDALMGDYARIVGAERAATDLAGFKAAWGRYMDAHDAWVKGGTINEIAQSRPGSALNALFQQADEAIDALIEANSQSAAAEAVAADTLVGNTMMVIAGVAGAAILLALLIMTGVRLTITRPLSAMTAALERLAAGDRTTALVEMHRSDELGTLAKAFEVFRSNARSLELAHEATQAAQQHAQALARHDALTGLPNRRVFAADLSAAVQRAAVAGGPAFSVMILDLDRFKRVNDLQGHAVGDAVLCEVAERLRSAMRRNDVVARLGGDEFAIIAPRDPIHSPDAEISLARRIIAAIGEPIEVDGGAVAVGASIGIACCPSDGTDADSVMRAADVAMYRAKHEGGNQLCFFETGMGEALRLRATLESDLGKAIAAGEIRPHYQPLVDIAADRVYGFEVLSRWQHEERGEVPPDIFIPLAERLGLIGDLTARILRQACRDAAAWSDDVILSVNISPLQLKDPALPTQLLTILNQERFPPSRLEIEITESALVSDLDTAKHILGALQLIGIKVALDDFGTGYSSLYHLSQLKFDKVKIDRSFVLSMGDSAENQRLVDSILGLAESIGLPAVAEGIETREMLDSLTQKGCLFGQGFYFGRAMTAEDAAKLLHDSREAAGRAG